VDANFCSDGFGPLLKQMVQALCRHVSDDSPTVRRLCLRGLVQVFLVIEYSFFFLFSSKEEECLREEFSSFFFRDFIIGVPLVQFDFLSQIISWRHFVITALVIKKILPLFSLSFVARCILISTLKE